MMQGAHAPRRAGFSVALKQSFLQSRAVGIATARFDAFSFGQSVERPTLNIQRPMKKSG
jgi:hypothetical protein